MTASRFAAALLQRGIELVIRNNRLRLWPAKAYGALSDDERAYIRHHRAELKELARRGVTPTNEPASTAAADTPPTAPAGAAHPARASERVHWDERRQAFVRDLGITI